MVYTCRYPMQSDDVFARFRAVFGVERDDPASPLWQGEKKAGFLCKNPVTVSEGHSFLWFVADRYLGVMKLSSLFIEQFAFYVIHDFKRKLRFKGRGVSCAVFTLNDTDKRATDVWLLKDGKTGLYCLGFGNDRGFVIVPPHVSATDNENYTEYSIWTLIAKKERGDVRDSVMDEILETWARELGIVG